MRPVDQIILFRILQGKPFAEEARWRERIGERRLPIASQQAIHHSPDPLDEDLADIDFRNAMEVLATNDDGVDELDADDERGAPVTPPIVAQPKVEERSVPLWEREEYKKCCLK